MIYSISTTALYHFFALFTLASRDSWGWATLSPWYIYTYGSEYRTSLCLPWLSLMSSICGNAWLHFHCFATSFHFLFPNCLSWIVGTIRNVSTAISYVSLVRTYWILSSKVNFKIFSRTKLLFSVSVLSHCPFQELLCSSFEIFLGDGFTNLTNRFIRKHIPSPRLYWISLVHY